MIFLIGLMNGRQWVIYFHDKSVQDDIFALLLLKISNKKSKKFIFQDSKFCIQNSPLLAIKTGNSGTAKKNKKQKKNRHKRLYSSDLASRKVHTVSNL